MKKIDDLISEYKERLGTTEKKKPATVRHYVKAYEHFLKWLENTEGEINFNKVDELLLKEYSQYLYRTFSPSTSATYLKIIANEFNIHLFKKTSSKSNLPEYMEGFKKWIYSKGFANSTIKSYVSKISVFIKWIEFELQKEFSPSALTNYDIVRYRGHLQDLGRKPTYINGCMFALAKFCEYGIEQGILKSNPVDEIVNLAIPLNSQPKEKWLKEKEQYAFLKEVKARGDAKDLVIMLMLLDVGLRVSELVNLKTKDVVLVPVDTAHVKVEFSKQNKSREVPIESRRLRQALLNYIKEYKPLEDGFFFFNGKGEKLTVRAIQQKVAKFKQKAGITRQLSPHSLRHSYAKNLTNNGLDLREVAILLGHVTKKGQPNINAVLIYTTPSMDDIRIKLRKGGI